MSDSTHYQNGFGNLLSECNYLVDKLRPMLPGNPEARRLLDRFAREVHRIDGEVFAATQEEIEQQRAAHARKGVA